MSNFPFLWIRKNLFSTWPNSLLTLLSLAFLYWLGSGFLGWALTQAHWQAIGDNLGLFFVGRYPRDWLWRTWAVLAIIASLGGFSWGVLAQPSQLFSSLPSLALGLLGAAAVALAGDVPSSALLLGVLGLLVAGALLGKRLGGRFPPVGLSLLWLLAFGTALWLLGGGGFLPRVPLDDLSGFLLTVLTAATSIVLSFPLGVLLALGRQSSLPAIRWLSVAYIELLRGLPLIGILFMAQVMLPLVLPGGVRPDRVLRAIAGFTLFSAAYLAENVRGGLQSVPRGQVEAARALGLNPFLVLALIVLPQALKAVIPALVGQFISLFKDTSLLAIVGLVDLLGMAQSILANPKYLGRYAEVYLFVAFIYWFCSYSLSLASRRLEGGSIPNARRPLP